MMNLPDRLVLLLLTLLLIMLLRWSCSVLCSSRYRTVGLLSTQVSDFPDLTLWTKSLTGHSARTWAHRVTPDSGEPGPAPFCRRAQT